jgi:hypothetical protein
MLNGTFSSENRLRLTRFSPKVWCDALPAQVERCTQTSSLGQNLNAKMQRFCSATFMSPLPQPAFPPIWARKSQKPGVSLAPAAHPAKKPAPAGLRPGVPKEWKRSLFRRLTFACSGGLEALPQYIKDLRAGYESALADFHALRQGFIPPPEPGKRTAG